jgi:GPI mannosyltransferase 3
VDRTRWGGVRSDGISGWLIAVLVLGLALRTWLAVNDHSVFWPDEIHQSLEQAHRAAFGYGLISWEFRDGARSWLFPGIIAGLWKLAAAGGVESSLTLVLLARLVIVAGSVASVWFAARLATHTGGAVAGIAAATILATFPPLVAFSHRAMSETASAPFIVLGACLLCRRSERAAWFAGVAVSIGCLLRYQNALIAVIFAIGLLFRRRYRAAAAFSTTGMAVALLGGLFDWATWGRPFHSLITYIEFNLVVGGAADFGVEPFWFFATTLWSSVGPLLIPIVACFLIGAAVDPILGAAVVVYVLAHSVLPHKELRFLVPCFPLFATVAGIGAERISRRLPRWVGALAAVATTAAFGYGLLHLSYERMGQYVGTARASLPVWKSEEEPTLLLAEAGKRSDLCGIAVLRARAGFTGGYTYLHRDVPLLYESELCDSAQSNYVIRSSEPAGPPLPAEYTLEAQRGSWALYRRDGACSGSARDDDRMLEGARDMGLVRRKPQQSADGAMRLELQRDAGAFTRGWGHGERIECDMARWAADKKAELELDLSVEQRPYQLMLQVRAHERTHRQILNVDINGKRIPVGRLSASFERHTIDIPDDVLRDGHNRIEFSFSRTARAGGNDPRELAALFRRIELIPKSDDFFVDLTKVESRAHLARGFNGAERDASGAFVWSEGPASEVVGTLARPRSPYVLNIVAESLGLIPSQRTRVTVNDRLIATVSMPRTWEQRRLLVPASALRRGENRVRFEYEAVVRPSRANRKLRDDRELAVRFRRIELAPVDAQQSLDLGTAGARPFLFEGWSGDESDGERDAVWTEARRASLVLSLAGVAKPVLRLTVLGYSHALPIAVSVSLNGLLVGSFAAPDGWQDIAIPLPAGDYSPHGEQISFDLDRTLSPSERDPRNRDRRQLALRVDRVWAESEGAEVAAVRALRSSTAAPTSVGIAARQ